MKEIRKPDKTLVKLLPRQKPTPGVVYVRSQFTLSFERDGKSYAFNTLTRQFVEATLPERCKAGEGCDELIETLFLVPEGKDECAFYNSISALMRAFARKKGNGGYTILPTMACNARCVYCYEEGAVPISMTPETADQVVRYILDSRRGDRVRLAWFGGGPLLRPEIIDRVCQGLRDAGIDYRSSMVSNGSLITPEIIAKMTGDWRLRKIQISMDGAEPDYIRRKRYCVYRNDYRRVLDAIDALSEAGVWVSVRCNVDEENWGGIPQFVEDLESSVDCKDKVRVYLSPLFSVRSGENDMPFWEKVVGARRMIEGAGFATSSALGGKSGFRVNHCMADGGGVVIMPDGSLYPCEHCPAESRFGDVWRGVTDEAARREFCRTDRTREQCRNCPFLPECTSFASCPVHDYHCREVHELMALDMLAQVLEKSKESDASEENDSFC